MKTRTVFRTWRDDGQVIALFPDLEWSPGFCTSYMHVGQHGAADYSGVIRATRAATPNEYKSLAHELQSGPEPYELAIVTHRRGAIECRDEYSWEYTDTFSGEANYSWVKRGTVKARSMLGAVRMAKAAAGIAGTDCTRENYGDMVALRPRGSCTVLFVE